MERETEKKAEKTTAKSKKTDKINGIIAISLIGLCLLFFGGYRIYVNYIDVIDGFHRISNNSERCDKAYYKEFSDGGYIIFMIEDSEASVSYNIDEEETVIPDMFGKYKVTEISSLCNGKLKKLHIGKYVVKGSGIINGCRIEEITIDKDNPNFVVENGLLMDKGKTMVYATCGDENNAVFDIPETVKIIFPKAFHYYGSISSLTVRSKTPPFYSFHMDGTFTEPEVVYVPAESLELYKTANGWNMLNIQPIP